MANLSIITINFNNKEGLLRTAKSITEQLYTNFEWIVIDGGSTDGSLDIIKQYQNHITYWCSEKDKGVYDAMNKGIRHSNGTWLNFMNSGDTFVSAETLQNVFNEAIPPTAYFLYSDTISQLEDGTIRISYQNHLKGNIIHQSCIYKKELHNIYGYYIVTPQIIISDLLFFLAIPDQFFYKTKTIISNFELGGISSTGTWAIKQKLCALVVYRKISFNSLYYLYSIIKLKRFVRNIITSTHKLFNK